MNKKRLYVIGNGFDCMYELPTRVLDFERYLSEKQVYNEIDDEWSLDEFNEKLMMRRKY